MFSARVVTALLCCYLASPPSPAQELAVTFDDLPLNGELAPGMTRTAIVKDVLRILNEHRVGPVYGFVNAKRLEDSVDGAEALRLWMAGGQRVGNHTYAHSDLNKVSAEDFLQDLRQNEPVLELLDPRGEWRWLRFPFLREGDTLEKRRTVRAALLGRRYRIAQVTIDYEDYLWNSPYARCVAKNDGKSIAWLRTSYLDMASGYLDADREMAMMVFGREINHVLLLHLGAFSGAILPDLFELLHKRGFRFVTLEQAQSDSIYESDPDAGSKYGGTLLEQWLDARHLKYPDAPMKPYKELDALCR
jgi:peptidoglycan/xylan/chitin deacetylase (PgdA/CDA1 family)